MNRSFHGRILHKLMTHTKVEKPPNVSGRSRNMHCKPQARKNLYSTQSTIAEPSLKRLCSFDNMNDSDNKWGWNLCTKPDWTTGYTIVNSTVKYVVAPSSQRGQFDWYIWIFSTQPSAFSDHAFLTPSVYFLHSIIRTRPSLGRGRGVFISVKKFHRFQHGFLFRGLDWGGRGGGRGGRGADDERTACRRRCFRTDNSFSSLCNMKLLLLYLKDGAFFFFQIQPTGFISYGR